MRYLIRTKTAFIETSPTVVEPVADTTVLVDNGVITAIDEEAADCELIDLSPYRLLPGLVDIHVHGGNGVDTMDASAESIIALSEFKLREGVTSFCPSTVTAPLDKTRTAIAAVRTAMSAATGAKVLGAFLEGPYIDVKYKGAHPEGFIREVSIDELEELISEGGVVSVAIAPGLSNALDAIEFLVSKGINVRLGHSSASFEQAVAAIAKGGSIFIHAYNAMSPFTHREPGMVGAALSVGDAYAEVICDLVHVHPQAVKILVGARTADRVILVTDCMSGGGLADGDYMLGELPVVVKDSIARTSDGALAGSTLSLITAVKNAHETVGLPLCDAVKMASLNPAAALGLDDGIGSIRPGKRADIIAIDDDYKVVFAMVDGLVALDTRK